MTLEHSRGVWDFATCAIKNTQTKKTKAARAWARVTSPLPSVLWVRHASRPRAEAVQVHWGQQRGEGEDSDDVPRARSRAPERRPVL